MKVAFTTSTGAQVDLAFRDARSFTVWEIAPHEAHYVTTVSIAGEPAMEEKRVALRVEALEDCALLCTRHINGPATASLVARQIYPLKIRTVLSVEEIIIQLQTVLRSNPPPWLRKKQAAGLIAHSPREEKPRTEPEDDILCATVADLLCRYPEAEELLYGEAFALFFDRRSLSTGGVLLKVGEALSIRGINADLFLSLLEGRVTGSGRHHARRTLFRARGSV